MIEALQIPSPKRTKRKQHTWDGFYPYYAGFSEYFAEQLISNSGMSPGSMIHDPWNGSGTTTYTAWLHEMQSIGFDLNPVMVIVAKARLVAATEADSIESLGRKIASQAKSKFIVAERDDPLTNWFGIGNAGTLRSLEMSIRDHLIGASTMNCPPTNMERLSSLAAINYVALFSVARELAKAFQSSNPTWLRYPRPDEYKLRFPNESIRNRYLRKLKEIAKSLEARAKSSTLESRMVSAQIRVADTTKTTLPPDSVDLIVTSPPYCTRIDYTAATRIELAILSGLSGLQPADLSAQMIGSTRVPIHDVSVSETWGATCTRFLQQIRLHHSKASGGYYYRTHLDYFDKISRSLANLSQCLKMGAKAIFVIQDSYYKEIHNDLPKIITEMCSHNNLTLKRRANFDVRRTMAASHPYRERYREHTSAVEAVLCFEKK